MINRLNIIKCLNIVNYNYAHDVCLNIVEY